MRDKRSLSWAETPSGSSGSASFVLIKLNIGVLDILTILADDYFTPYSDKSLDTFEGGIRAIINDHFKRLALTGVCQINSTSNDFLQVTDLMLGCVLLDLKIQTGILSIDNLSSTKKIQCELLKHIKDRLGIGTSFFLCKNGIFYNNFSSRKPSFQISYFDPKKAVHLIKSEPSSL